MKLFSSRRTHLFFWLIILAGNFILLFLAVFAPLFRSAKPDFAAAIYATFSPFCHQLPERCFWLWSQPLPLCGRCLGILSGFFLGTILYPMLRSLRSTHLPSVRWLVLFSLPIAVDTFSNLASLWNTPTWPRFCLGLSWGIILPFYFFPVLARSWGNWPLVASSSGGGKNKASFPPQSKV